MILIDEIGRLKRETQLFDPVSSRLLLIAETVPLVSRQFMPLSMFNLKQLKEIQ